MAYKIKQSGTFQTCTSRLRQSGVFVDLFPAAPEALELTDLGVSMKLNRQDFNSTTAGTFTSAKYQSLFSTSRSISSGGSKSIIDVSGTKYIKHSYPSGTRGSANTGMNDWLDINESTKALENEVWLFYDIWPIDIISWSLTGKMFGVVYGNFSGAGIGATGGNSISGVGGSLRLAPDPELDIGLYVYDHNMGSQYGYTMGTSKFTRLNLGVQNKIAIRVVNNTGNNSDGYVQVWHDGVLVCTATNAKWRVDGVTATGFGMIAVQTFSGGSNTDPQFDLDPENYADGGDPHFRQSYLGFAAGDGTRDVYAATDLINTPFGILGVAT